MLLDELQQRLRDMQGQAGVRAVFGETIQIDGRKVIPVASVAYGFGMGGGEGADKAGGGGGGGGVRVEPLAVIEVENDRLKVSPIVNVNRMGTLGILLVAWCVFWISRTIRAAVRVRAAS